MKKFKVVFFFLLMIPGWWCENDQSSTSQKSSTLGSQNSSTSGPQNSKNAVLQAQEDHFEFIFNKVKRILIKFKKQSLPSVFDEKKPLKGEYDVFHAYCCSKIGNQQIHQKIRNWIYKTNNKEKFLSYFTALASDLTKNQFSKFSRQPFLIIFFFDLALSFDLEDEKISGFFESLIKKEEREILLLKLILVELVKAKNSPLADQSIKDHFNEKLSNYYLPLLRNSHKLSLSLKIKLAQLLKKLKLTDWKREDWEKAAFLEYERFFRTNPFLNSRKCLSQNFINAQKKWISEKLRPGMIEFQLWQKLRGSEEMPESIFGQIFSQDHLKILKDYIQNNPEECFQDMILFCHKDLHPAVKQWVGKLKKIPNDKKEEELIHLLGTISVLKVLLGF